MAKAQLTSTSTTIRNAKTGRFVTVRGAGALKGHLTLAKGVDLTKPIASQKNQVAGQPHFGDDPPEQWFRDAICVTDAMVVPIHLRISLEAERWSRKPAITTLAMWTLLFARVCHVAYPRTRRGDGS